MSLDFLRISTKTINKVDYAFPKFVVTKSKDLMVRGKDFYAIWDEENGLWTTDEFRAIQLMDNEVQAYSDTEGVHGLYFWDADSGCVDRFHKFCQKQTRDTYKPLDEKIIFSNDPVNKKDYASKRLAYPLEAGDYSAWNEILDTLYSPEERRKIEWTIGAIVTGDSKKIQKFVVFYGSAGTGKSTIINIIQMLFEGYCSTFDSKALGSASNAFALDAFKDNPMVAVQHDGNLSKIEDNTKLNSLVSHEKMVVNEKFKAPYEQAFKTFLIMGTNSPVKITDAKSGLLRRLIDIVPTGNKLPRKEYNKCMKQIPFELGAIAAHCKEVYLEDPEYYDSYIPINMMGATNDFWNFIEEYYEQFKAEKNVVLSVAWKRYREYVDDAKVPYPYQRRVFKEELKNYFEDFKERTVIDGKRYSNYYIGFISDKFEETESEKLPDEKNEKKVPKWLELTEQESIFDKECSECPAQLANDNETPKYKWENVKTTLKDIDTKQLHYVKVPMNHIVIDFDIKNEKGEKDAALNIIAASDFPATYAEVSKGGAGLHLHYIYTGDVERLSRLYNDNVEVKVFTGKSSLRRRLSRCNNLPISTISSGLPLKEEKKVLQSDVACTEKGLRTSVIKALRKEVHSATKPNMDFIKHILDQAYESGMKYDLTDLESDIIAFAAASTNQSEYCMGLIDDIHLKSEDIEDSVSYEEKPIAFYDIEVFPNLFIVNYKLDDRTKPVVRLINPTSDIIEELVNNYRLIGFNNRDYDNHILYGSIMGYTVYQLYQLSQTMINGSKEEKRGAKFGNAYNLSYTDIYDFASAGNKQSLKKWEIQMRKEAEDPGIKMSDELREMIKHIKHHELGLPWDKPVPEELWDKVAEYCDDDVLATEALFYRLSADWTARQILADLAEMTPNDTTNTLTTRVIFGKNKTPQGEFNYRDMSQPVLDMNEETYSFLAEACPEMMEETHGEAGSLLPYFPGYKFDKYKRKSYYRDEEFGEGGYVYSEPGIHYNVALLDVASMHPHSAIAECIFGVKYTSSYRGIVEGRVDIKHEDWDKVNDILDGKLTKWIQKVKDGEMKSKELANALKTAINSVYGLTSAKFTNPFRDERNVDNIIAKRGELFMIDLKHAVQARGFTVAHIKTDSIKIPDATPDIIEFVMNFGKRYGYTFEHEATYKKMCLIDKAQYAAKFATADECLGMYAYAPGENMDEGGKWTFTGAAFAHPYVSKTIFTHKPVTFDDFCEVNSVKTAIYLDMNENLPDVTSQEKELKKLEDKYKKGELSDTSFETEGQRLASEIENGHNYIFVGKVGEFTPIEPGRGGGIAVASRGDKYAAVTGTKGYRWLESEVVKANNKQMDIDMSYYRHLVDTAMDTIREYGDAEAFLA